MNLHLLPRRAAAGLLAAALLAGAVLPAGAAAPSTSKEEIVYANLSAEGEVTGVYVVSQFDGVAGQTITDYGDYTALRNMTTTDPLNYENGVLTLTPAEDGKIYCEGTLAEAQLPWLFELTYTLDGAEVSPEELAGKSGALVLTLSAKIVEEQKLTTLMITHNMKDAIKYGNRLIMMHEGHIIYDVSGEEKQRLKVSDLLAKFQVASGSELANDRMILS